MKRYLTKDNLDKIFETYSSTLKTGVDKITSQKFFEIKNDEFDLIIEKSLSQEYKFTRWKKILLSNNREAYIPTVRDRILIELLHRILRKKYRVRYENRHRIISVLKSKLETHIDRHVFRLDIKKFFPSIPHTLLLNRIKKQSLLSPFEYYLVKEYLKNKNGKGVPIGLSLSSLLAEIYLEEFDRKMRRIDQRICCYYRYVDDIVLIFNGNLQTEEIKYIEKTIFRIFKEFGLKNNNEKYMNVLFQSKSNLFNSFSYLGYKFIKVRGQLKLFIDDKKLIKILNKIDLTFNDYATNKNLDLLKERLRFLVRRNTMLKKNPHLERNLNLIKRPRLVNYGTVENYKSVCSEQWKGLDRYLQSRFYNVLQNKIKKDRQLKNEIFSLSFARSVDSGAINLFHKKDNDYFRRKILLLNKSMSLAQLMRFNRKELEKTYKEILKI